MGESESDWEIVSVNAGGPSCTAFELAALNFCENGGGEEGGVSMQISSFLAQGLPNFPSMVDMTVIMLS